MDETPRSLPNSESDDHEDDHQIKGEYYAGDETNENSDNGITDGEVRASHEYSTNRDLIKYDADDERTGNESPNNDLKGETHVHVPPLRLTPTTARSNFDHHVEMGANSGTSKVNSRKIETKRDDMSLNDPGQITDRKTLRQYLNKHEQFLKSIDQKRQLSPYDRTQLDLQREELRKLQKRLDLQIDQTSFKQKYEKQKEDDNLRKARAYQQRRFEEAKLRETRKPRIQTTFRLPVEDTGFKPQLSQRSSVGHNVGHHSNQIHFNKTDIERRSTGQLDNQLKEYSEDVGENLRELVTDFVERSKQSWKNK